MSSASHPRHHSGTTVASALTLVSRVSPVAWKITLTVPGRISPRLCASQLCTTWEQVTRSVSDTTNPVPAGEPSDVRTRTTPSARSISMPLLRSAPVQCDLEVGICSQPGNSEHLSLAVEANAELDGELRRRFTQVRQHPQQTLGPSSDRVEGHLKRMACGLDSLISPPNANRTTVLPRLFHLKSNNLL